MHHHKLAVLAGLGEEAALVLPQLPQSGLAVGGGGVGLAVLLLPGLNKLSQDNTPDPD